MTDHHLIDVEEQSQVAEARRAAANMCASLGFDDVKKGEVAIAVTEAATNVLKHASRGHVLLRRVESRAAVGVELLCVDRGPGMDADRCLRDGFSTAGTQGNGLGAVSRLADDFDLFSEPGQGVVLWARFWRSPPGPMPVFTGAVSIPKSGEVVCGDAWLVLCEDDRTVAMVADGLGHGAAAHAASHAAVEICRAEASRSPKEIVELMHERLRSTRGAAVAVAELAKGTVRLASVGNISVSLTGPSGRRMLVSQNGTLGLALPRVQELNEPVPEGAVLLMHSDGIGTNWNLDRYRGVRHQHPALLAALLWRDFVRGRDDATVLAVRESSG